MKKNFSLMAEVKHIFTLMLCAVLCAGMVSCNDPFGDDDDPTQPSKPKYDYNLLVGKWTLNNFSVVFTNLDTQENRKDIKRSNGYVEISKGTDEFGEDCYTYTENFLTDDNGTLFSGMLRIDEKEGVIEFCKPEGFLRDDIDVNTFPITTLTDKQMNWFSEYTGTHSTSINGNTVSWKEKRVAEGSFTKQK